MRTVTYKEWKERDNTFNLILDIIYRINRGEQGTLDELLKKEYKKYLGDTK